MPLPNIKKAIFKGKQTQAAQAQGYYGAPAANYAQGYPPFSVPGVPPAQPLPQASAAQTGYAASHVNAAVAFVKENPIKTALGVIGGLFIASRIFKV